MDHDSNGFEYLEAGAEVLLAISREFEKSLEWLLTGED
jgi:hypothetical protein